MPEKNHLEDMMSTAELTRPLEVLIALALATVKYILHSAAKCAFHSFC